MIRLIFVTALFVILPYMLLQKINSRRLAAGALAVSVLLTVVKFMWAEDRGLATHDGIFSVFYLNLVLMALVAGSAVRSLTLQDYFRANKLQAGALTGLVLLAILIASVTLVA